MSSSKRGRKRNDLLPPNRARDVQRAFRARRAAHLQALEQRVTELEEENVLLRQALNLPPAVRPQLGRGPTGNDKPRGHAGPHYNSFQHLLDNDGRDSSSPESEGGETRSSSVPPGSLSSTVPDRSGPAALDGPAWDDAIMMNEHTQEIEYTPSSSYPSAPLSAPLPSKAHSYQPPPYGSPASSPSQSSSATGFVYTPSPGPDTGSEKPSTSYRQPSPVFASDPVNDRPHPVAYSPSPQHYIHRAELHEDMHPHHGSYSSSYELDMRHDHNRSSLAAHQHGNAHSMGGAMTFSQSMRRHTEPYHYAMSSSPQLSSVNAGPHTIRVPSPPNLGSNLFSPHRNMNTFTS